MGPIFKRTTVLAAGLTYQPLQTAPAWQHRTPETDVVLEYSIIGTVAGEVEFEVTSGSEVLVQRGPVSGGGTAGVFPSFQDVKSSLVAFAGREIAFTLFEIGGGAGSSVMLEVHLSPI